MDFNYDRINYAELGLMPEEFKSLQAKYSKMFEEYVKTLIDLDDINKYLDSLNIAILDRLDKYPYHKDSNLGSKYIYLRNNMHIERLSKEDISILKNNPDEEFIKRTFDPVVYERLENNVYFFIGNPVPEREVKGKSLIFEFAHDTLKEDLKTKSKAMKAYDYLKDLFQKYSDKLNIPISIYENDGLM